MKSIKELGLELIELEDQVLLVDQNKPRLYGNYYVLKNAWGLDKHEITEWTEAKHSILSDKKSKPTGVIVASTKPLEGLPLLVIEDEVGILAEHSSEVQEATYTPPHKTTYKHGFIRGYNKAKETYKFTEEDMGDLIEICIDLQEEGRLIKQIDVIQRFNKTHKKELWIEVEEKSIEEIEIELGIYGHDEGLTESEYSEYIKKNNVLKLKITNNQIKAVWK